MKNFSDRNKKALGLCSGGLDSILAALVLRKQGIDVTWVSFVTPFFSADKAQEAARRYDVPLIIRDISDQYLVMLKNPAAGYGQNMNPCLDCHTMMFAEAGKIMQEQRFDFLFSGEVAGQRPMSQTKQSLRYVEKRSGFDGYIVRPLSAKVLPLTKAEEEGLVDRSRLLGLNGRSRKPQMQIAKEMGVSNYPAPAGGCLLTDVRYSMKLRDLIDFNPFARISEYHLLKAGRHLRLDADTKLVVGRDMRDNDTVLKYYEPEHDIQFRLVEKPGPAVIMTCASGVPDMQILEKAACICATYGKTSPDEVVEVSVVMPGGSGKSILTVKAGQSSDFSGLMIS